MDNSRAIAIKKKRLLLAFYFKKIKKIRAYHVHRIQKTRKQQGEFFTLVKLIEKYPARYRQYFRMTKDKFQSILNLIKKELEPSNLSFRKDVISAKEKLVITLIFLATGSSFVDMSFRFRMGVSTVKKVIEQTMDVIIAKCFTIAIPPSLSKAEWVKISEEFLTRWNFPNCLGAVDGKHVLSYAPKNSGSLYFNYKKSFSLNLMAVVDAKYKFIMVDIGAYGSNADSTVFSNSAFGKSWLHNPSSLNIPKEVELPGTTQKLPYVIIGDEGFSLKSTIMRPFPGQRLSTRERIFNYRLSRARRVVENAFGILANTWRILLKRLEVEVDNMNKITLTCCILHNLLRMDMDSIDESPEEDRITERETPTSDSGGYDIRSQFADWCIAEGNVDFQYNMI